MVLTGEPIDAAEGYRIGLINRVVPASQLNDSVLELANRLAAKSPSALRLAKEAINRSLSMGLMEGLAYESHLHALACGLPDKQEGVRAFLEKRKPDFSGKGSQTGAARPSTAGKAWATHNELLAGQHRLVARNHLLVSQVIGVSRAAS